MNIILIIILSLVAVYALAWAAFCMLLGAVKLTDKFHQLTKGKWL